MAMSLPKFTQIKAKIIKFSDVSRASYQQLNSILKLSNYLQDLSNFVPYHNSSNAAPAAYMYLQTAKKEKSMAYGSEDNCPGAISPRVQPHVIPPTQQQEPSEEHVAVAD